MRYTVRWSWQGRICTVHTDSQIDGDLCAGAVSDRFQCHAVLLQGETQVSAFSNGQRQQ